jgi:hypothetical protein
MKQSMIQKLVMLVMLTMTTTLSTVCFADNPIVQTLYTADPAPMVHDGVCYVFTSHDEDVIVRNFFTMNDWRCYSTTDMVNWTDLGSPSSYKDFSWARGDAWAGQCIYRNGKFYYYVPINQKGGGNAIGVAVADKPQGPYRDAIGKPLLAGHGYIDPTVFIDDDGQAYLYWGNPKLLYVKLNEDMISYSGQVVEVPLTTESFGVRSKDDRTTRYEEGPWLYKRKDLYYMVFAAGPISEHIAYATSPAATGPWTFRDTIMPTQGGSFTNHPGLIDYKGNSYFFYHNGALPDGGGFHRSVCVEQFEFNEDGTIPTISMTKTGPAQVGHLNPYVQTEAETICWASGIETEKCSEGGMNICDIENGDWIKVKGVDFGSGATSFKARVASETNGGSITIRLDSPTGTLVETCAVPGTGGWQKWETLSCTVSGASGVHDVYFKFTGGSGSLFNFNWWKFSGSEVIAPASKSTSTGNSIASKETADGSASSEAETIWLSTLDVSRIEQGWGEGRSNRSVYGRPLTINGRVFERGIGTHANSSIPLLLDGNAIELFGSVGVDDETNGRGSVIFKILADEKEIWNSGLMRSRDTAKEFTLDVRKCKSLLLLAADAGDGADYDHADWGNLKITMINHGKPRLDIPPIEDAVILTPKASPKPRINGAKVFGVRPGSPFLFRVMATGDRPMTFSIDGLPSGLILDPKTGQITGCLEKAGEYDLVFHAKNALGQAERKFKIVCGSQIGLTPAMGWNSWNCFASSVTAEKIKAATDAMVSSGLIDHGWTYINIDDFWQVHRDSKDPSLQGPKRDSEGRILPNPRFPDMKGLADYVHGKGLKIGIYSVPGPWTCGGCVGSFDHELQDAQQYAEWGFDYLKYDWCSYNPAFEAYRGVKDWDPSSKPNITYGGGDDPKKGRYPFELMHKALAQQPRDIIYSLCQYGMGSVWEWGTEVGGNSWRTTQDINDSWGSMSGIGFGQAGHEKYAGPGHFNDPDMLVIGKVGWGPQLRNTRLTPNEQYTHISLWCLLSSPLLIGCDMTQLDEFTLNLLTNDEVLEVNQDPLGCQAARVVQDERIEVWVKELEDGSKAVGLFNRGSREQSITIKWSDLGVSGEQTVRDLWRQQDIGKYTGQFQTKVGRHGVVLVKIIPAN